jgi:peptide/nickel transport system substrate-binding protein
MSFKKKVAAVAALCALARRQPGREAQTIRIANQGDALSLDPHSLNESLQLSVTANVYETLVGRNKDLSLAPLLATSWKQTSPTSGASNCARACSSMTARRSPPTTWSSASRARRRRLRHASNVSDIKEVRKVGDLAVDIETKARSRSCPTCSPP